ncbi:hypothetical protein VTO42DRAFT_8528 [Malbranchea cinnamomea]
MHSLKLRATLWALLVLLSFVAASSQQDDGLNHYVRIHDRRADETTTAEDSARTTEAAETETEEPTRTTAELTGTKTDEEETGTETGTKTTKTTPTSVDPRSPVGGIEMITPGPFDPTTYIKIGDYATFVWNYTSLIVTPSAVDVIASCSRNDHTYTISANMSVEQTGSVVWDTSEYMTGDAPLLTEMYTLIVHDSELEPSDLAKPGHLGSDTRETFGMYWSRTDSPSGNVCATCNGALSSRIERQGILFMLGMVAITICSFTWFASGLGLFNEL